MSEVKTHKTAADSERTPLLSQSSQNDTPASYTIDSASINGSATSVHREISSVEQQAQRQEPPMKSYFTFVLPMAVGIFLTAMDGTIIVSSYAAIGSELNQLQNTSWIATAYFLTITSFQPLYGKLSDIFGRKNCLIFAYTIFAIGCLLCGLARNMNELIAARAFTGIGGGGMQTLVSIIMSDVVPLRSRGTWQGVLNIVWATGNTVGASLGGYFADTIGWRWSFLIQVPIALIAIVSVSLALSLPEKETSDFNTKIRRIDFGGAATLVLSVFFLLLGLDRGSNKSWNDKYTISSLILFVLVGIIFGFIELKFAREPFAPKRIIANRALIASYLVNLFGVASAFCIIFHFPLYLQAVLRKSASEAGLWLIISVVMGLVGSLSGGLIMQATGRYYMLTVFVYAVFLSGTVVLTAASGIVFESLVAMGIGSGITTSLISLIANAGPEDQAIATAVSYLFRSLGSSIGISVGSAIVQDTLRADLRKKLVGTDIDEIVRRVRESLKYIETLDPDMRVVVRGSYETAIHVTFYFSLVMSGLALVSSLFIVEKPLVRRT
ncbi:member of the major facilitator superfamily [Cyathus striatus]|nr:member of the major facilitator superfamily [Cyathus striatus]